MSNNFDTAPRDGTVILIDEYTEAGTRYCTSIQWQSFPENPEWDMFIYTDELVQDVCPSGPEAPFNWYPLPEVMT